METGDGMGPGSAVATDTLLWVCWRHRVCIGSFQRPSWSGGGRAALPPGLRCVLEADGVSPAYGMSKHRTACAGTAGPPCRPCLFRAGR